MIKLSCINCKNTFDHSSRYDENIDEAIICPHCNWQASKWTFPFINEKEEKDKEDENS